MLDIVRKLKRKLKPSDTEERCGLILKDGTVFQTDNIHADPAQGFIVPSAELLAHEANLMGTWHTHPGKSASMSHEDYRGFSNWPQLTHFIVGQKAEVRAYRATDGIIHEVSLAAD